MTFNAFFINYYNVYKEYNLQFSCKQSDKKVALSFLLFLTFAVKIFQKDVTPF